MPTVRYESAVVYVKVFQSRVRAHIDFSVGLIDHPQDGLTAVENIAMAGGPALVPLRPTTADQLIADMHELAKRLREYGGEILRDDAAAFEMAKELRRTRTADFTSRAEDEA